MTGLIWKDLLCLRKTVNIYVVILAGFLALCIAVDFPVSSIASFVSVIVMVLPMTAFSYDRVAKWEVYGLALPVSRTKTVAARYLLHLLLMGGVAVIAAVFTVVLLLTGRRDSAWELLLTFGGCLAAGVLFNSILLPLIYRFGIERAKIIAFGLIIVIAGLVTLWMVPVGGAEWLETFINDADAFYQDEFFITAASFGFVAVSFALLGVSFLISRAIYKRKEM